MNHSWLKMLPNYDFKMSKQELKDWKIEHGIEIQSSSSESSSSIES